MTTPNVLESSPKRKAIKATSARATHCIPETLRPANDHITHTWLRAASDTPQAPPKAYGWPFAVCLALARAQGRTAKHSIVVLMCRRLAHPHKGCGATSAAIPGSPGRRDSARCCLIRGAGNRRASSVAPKFSPPATAPPQGGCLGGPGYLGIFGAIGRQQSVS